MNAKFDNPAQMQSGGPIDHWNRMGEWMMIPGAEMIEARINSYRPARRSRGSSYERRYSGICVHSDLQVAFNSSDIANLADVIEAPLWECEIPLTDDGF